MVAVRNISAGPRGVYDAAGILHMLEPGDEAEIDTSADDLAGEWFDVAGEPDAKPKRGRSKAEVADEAGE